MKKFLVLFLAFIITCPSSFGEVNSENGNRISGIWLGKMKVSEKLELQLGFIITKNDIGMLTATMNVIEQKAFNIPMDKVSFQNDSLQIEMTTAGISYSGKFNSENQTILGTYQQGEAVIELNLHEVDELPGEVERPQTPVRPYPYKEENILFENTADNVHLAGTVTSPGSETPSPAVILVAGSGHTDRNETKMGHFLLLADYLTRNGIIVLRYDKRGVGESTGDYDKATTYDFASDVKAGIKYLKNRKDVDSKNIGIIGHSEGALIAPMIASELDDLAFIILMGGSGVPGDKIRLMQTDKIARVNGVPDNSITQELEQIKHYHDIIKSAENDENKKLAIKNRYPQMPDGLIEYLLKPWYQNFIIINPKDYLEKVKCPVLAITGENDLQCPAAENLPEIEDALKSGGNKDYSVITMPELNHLFQTSKSGSPTEYENIAEIIAPSALEYMNSWIAKKIRNL